MADSSRFNRLNHMIAGVTDSNSANDSFVWDRTTDTVTLISHAASSATDAANGASTNPKSSGDGNWIAFTSSATDLVAGATDANTGSDVFLYNRTAGTSGIVSHASGSTTTTAGTGTVGGGATSITPDGRYVAFDSTATGIVAGQVGNGGLFDDRTTGVNILVSQTAGAPTTCSNAGGGLRGIVSAAGDFVVFDAYSTT